VDHIAESRLGPARAAAIALLVAALALAAAEDPAAAGGLAVDPLRSDFRLTWTGERGADPDLGATSPALAYDRPADTYLAVWEAALGHTGRTALFGRRLSPAGRRLGRVLRISPPRGTGSEGGRPHLAFSPRARRFLVAWPIRYTTAAVARTVGARGRLGPVRRLPELGELTGIYSSFDVDPSPTGRGWLMTWAAPDERVYAQPLDAGARPIGVRIPLSPAGEQAQAPSAAVSFAERNALVAWSIGHDYFGSAIHAAIVAPGGAPRAPEATVYAPPGRTLLDQPAVAFNPRADRYLIAWDDLRERRLWGAPFSAAGASLGPVEPLSDVGIPSRYRPPSLTPAPGTSAFLLSYPLRNRIFAQVLAAAGPLGRPRAVAHYAGHAGYYGDLSVPALAARGRRRGDLLAVWSGTRGRQSGPDIYGQRLTEASGR
jgi:hypothetical protein